MLFSKKKIWKKFDFCVSSQNPKWDLGGIKYRGFAGNTLSETKIQNLHP